MSFRGKTRLLRFASLRDASSPAPSLSALGDLPFSGAAHRARQRPERGAGRCLSPSRADAGRADGRALRLHGSPRGAGPQRDGAARRDAPVAAHVGGWAHARAGERGAQASAALWNTVQAQATRANAIYAREIVIGLPTELNRDEQVALMRDYVRAAFTSRGMVADWVIHDKAGNPHAHVMLTTKPLSESGFASNVTPLRDDAGQPVRTAEGKIKYAVWNDGAAVLREWRAGWARVANYHLQEAGLDIRIDHRSLH